MRCNSTWGKSGLTGLASDSSFTLSQGGNWFGNEEKCPGAEHRSLGMALTGVQGRRGNACQGAVTAPLRTREVRRVGLLAQRPHFLWETTSYSIRTAEPASVLLQPGSYTFFLKKGKCLLVGLLLSYFWNSHGPFLQGRKKHKGHINAL